MFEPDKIDQANELFMQFVRDVKAGHVPTSMVSDLRNAALQLWMVTKGDTVTPELVEALWSDEGVSYSRLALLIPSFLYAMNRRLAITQVANDGVVPIDKSR